jgi:hypothetical protein
VENYWEERPKRDGCWCADYGRKSNIVEARKVLLLQKDRTYGKGLFTRTRRIIKTEEGPARFAYTTIKVLTKEQKKAFTKLVMEGGDEDFWNGELDRCQYLQAYLLNMYK